MRQYNSCVNGRVEYHRGGLVVGVLKGDDSVLGVCGAGGSVDVYFLGSGSVAIGDNNGVCGVDECVRDTFRIAAVSDFQLAWAGVLSL